MLSETDGLVISFNLGLSREARTQTSSMGAFGFEDELPSIQVGIIVVFKDASGFSPLVLLRAVGGVFIQRVVEAKGAFLFRCWCCRRSLGPNRFGSR